MTIAAIATASGEGGIGIVRISGIDSKKIVSKIFFPKKNQSFIDIESNRMIYGLVKDLNKSVVDEAMVVFMQAPHSYTGEDVVEIQCHGNTAALKKILQLVISLGSRLAEPGEFTKRAFLNGQLDLTQAEAVMDIIKARSERALKMAVNNQQGLLSQEINALREKLVNVMVQIEVAIDYPDDDIEEPTAKAVSEEIIIVQKQVKKLISSSNTGRIMREGLRVVIVGKPNVGKSSLLNILLKDERAIVSQIAGTTRDVIEERLLIAGIPIVLVDTAGIRYTEDIIEKIGVDRSYKSIQQADLLLVVLDGSENLVQEDYDVLNLVLDKKYLVLINKQDLKQKLVLPPEIKQENVLSISANTGEGLNFLEQWLEKFVFGANEAGIESVLVQNIRHESLLKETAGHLAEALEALVKGLPLDCATIDINQAIEKLGLITGVTVSDEIIKEIFARFCLGK